MMVQYVCVMRGGNAVEGVCVWKIHEVWRVFLHIVI